MQTDITPRGSFWAESRLSARNREHVNTDADNRSIHADKSAIINLYLPTSDHAKRWQDIRVLLTIGGVKAARYLGCAWHACCRHHIR